MWDGRLAEWCGRANGHGQQERTLTPALPFGERAHTPAMSPVSPRSPLRFTLHPRWERGRVRALCSAFAGAADGEGCGRSAALPHHLSTAVCY
jgi:hypothetical protein